VVNLQRSVQTVVSTVQRLHIEGVGDDNGEWRESGEGGGVISNFVPQSGENVSIASR
jgi:hypothetical protein